MNSTEQWTEPFYFEIKFEKEKEKFNNYTFLFGDLNNNEISYEDFATMRNYWDVDYHRTNNWDPFNRDWKYIIAK